MFRYQDTNKVSKPKESQRKVVVEVRKVTYLNKHPDERVIEPVITEGYETVKEVVVSPDFNQVIPKVVDSKTVNATQVVKRVKKKDKKKLFLHEPEGYNE